VWQFDEISIDDGLSMYVCEQFFPHRNGTWLQEQSKMSFCCVTSIGVMELSVLLCVDRSLLPLPLEAAVVSDTMPVPV